MRAVLRREGFEDNARPALAASGLVDHEGCETLLDALRGEGLDPARANGSGEALGHLARWGLVAFRDEAGAATLVPVAETFEFADDPLAAAERFRLSKFHYVQVEDGVPTARSPLGLALVRLHEPSALALLARFAEPTRPRDALAHGDLGNRGREVVAMLAQAGVILPCDEDGRTLDDTHDDRRMWDFPELLYHSRSRVGRSGLQVGATFEHQGRVPKPPALKENPWSAGALPLYRPAVLSRDMSLFEAMETRRSVRSYSPTPLFAWELGEFLFRTMRVRRHVSQGGFEMAARPYPNGGGIYEQELYVTIEACADLPRGFYYYDPLAHALCPIGPPDADMAMLVEEAVTATAGLGRPQILFTIASRFGAFNWKYSSMAYAAQLKNVGVIYQTMYLVATAMGLGGCGLGLGNADRFARMTGLDYESEGSIGEFMIGRPL